MDEQEILAILKRVGAVITDHFVFTSGLHGSYYVNKDAIYPHTLENIAFVPGDCPALRG